MIKLSSQTKNSIITFSLIILFSLIFFIPFISPKDFEDMGANEIIFSKKSLYDMFFKMEWSNQSPFYFIIIKYWSSLFGVGYISLRSFNYLPHLGSLTLLYLIAFSIWKNRNVSFLAMALFATAPLNVAFTYFGRMYLFLIFFSLLSIFAAIKFISEKNYMWIFILCISSILNGYNHYVSIGVIGATFLGIIVSLSFDLLRESNSKNRTIIFKNLLNICLAFLVVVISLIPQSIRIINYLTSKGAGTNSYSLPSGFFPTLHAVAKLNFSIPFGSLYEQDVKIYSLITLSFLLLLFLSSFLKTNKIAAYIGFIYILVPLIALSFLAQHYDVRHRHYVFIVPLVYMFFSHGLYASIKKIIRKKHLAVFNVIGVFLLLSHLYFYKRTMEIRFIPWGQLVVSLDKVLDKGKADFYITPSFIASAFILANQMNNTDIEPKLLPKLREGNRKYLYSSIKNSNDVVLVSRSGKKNQELDSWHKILLEKGYRSEILRLYRLNAYIYSKNKNNKLLAIDTACKNKKCDSLDRALGSHLSDLNESTNSFKLSEARVSRVLSDGTIASPIHYFEDPLSKIYGRWALSSRSWHFLEDAYMKIAGKWRKLNYYHPIRNEKLILSYPKTTLQEGINIQFGFPNDTKENDPEEKPVSTALLIDKQPIANISLLNNNKWNTICIDTSKFANQKKALSIIIQSESKKKRQIGFVIEKINTCKPLKVINLDTSSLSENMGSLMVLTKSHLIDSGNDLVPNKPLYHLSYSAKDMHEIEGDTKLGKLFNRWPAGSFVWQSIGNTSQLINGKRFNGIWLHPQTNKKIIIRSENILTTSGLKAVFGFTDFSVQKARLQKLTEPVSIKIFINDEIKLDTNLERGSGLKEFMILKPGEKIKKDSTIDIEIFSKKDSWSHLVGDILKP